jgi:hypothetical protein
MRRLPASFVQGKSHHGAASDIPELTVGKVYFVVDGGRERWDRGGAGMGKAGGISQALKTSRRTDRHHQWLN